MSLNKSHGNMYEWVTHTHTHLRGKCTHACIYCSVQAMADHYPNVKRKYTGRVEIVDKELSVNYGKDKTIFVEHCNDLMVASSSDIRAILRHCCEYPGNDYVFQTKDPARLHPYVELLPARSMVGTTIETNRNMELISKAPPAWERAQALAELPVAKKFITIEPVLDFDVGLLTAYIRLVKPDFLNLGADSKGQGLPEPTVEKIERLVDALARHGIDLREKANIERLKRESGA